MKVGIAGIGGIGSNVARYLAQAGLSSLKVVDFDRVEVSNLNRQFYSVDQAGQMKTLSLKTNLLKIFPGMAVETIDCRVKSGNAVKIFEDCDIVVEGFDRKTSKKMLIEELADAGKKVVAASGIAGEDMEGVVNAGLAAARAAGRVGGRPTLEEDKIAEIRRRLANQESWSTICQAISISRSTLAKYAKADSAAA